MRSLFKISHATKLSGSFVHVNISPNRKNGAKKARNFCCHLVIFGLVFEVPKLAHARRIDAPLTQSADAKKYEQMMLLEFFGGIFFSFRVEI